MKSPRALTAIFILALCLAGAVSQQQPQAVEVYFSPKGGCTDAVVRELGKAKKSVLVQAYSFTSKPIAEALVEAHQRGVAVTLILDDSDKTGNGTMIDVVAAGGDVVRIDAKHAIAHNKVMVIDGAVVLTGSFNFTAAAETSNAENLLVLRNPSIATKYTDNWKAHSEHSTPYVPKP
jgi:phosphatidylserine/phosphatidylglycerophosphate/cardiolipin synthase-like enzyme